jgi:peptidoglycan/LPS O-acetylase OafA/YrhL
MPFFMYLSGYVTFLSRTARTPLARWPSLIRRRAARLLVPFLLFGLGILAAKLIAARIVAVDNVPTGLWDGLRALVWDTGHSPATSVWYILVLFVYCAATPLLLQIGGRALVFAVAALLYLVPAPQILYLDRICSFFIFFVVGGLAADAGERWSRIVDTWRWPALAALTLLAATVASGQIAFTWTEGMQGFPYKWALLVAGLLSMPALHGVARTLRAPVLDTLGRYSFVIYLLNTPFIGVAKAVLLKLTPWDGAHFAPFAAALMLAGTAGPILTKRLLLRRWGPMDRMTD